MQSVGTVAIIGSLRCRRFRGDGDVTTQIDWVRGCRFRAIIKVVKILMTAGLYDFVELFVAVYKFTLFSRSMATFEEFLLLLVLTRTLI